jgi:hypothetical protein
MGITLSFSSADSVGPALRVIKDALLPENLFPIIGRSATNAIRDHLFGLNLSRPNALGGPRTNFYASAARATHFDEVDDGVVISINHVGIAQRCYGGTIRPVHAKYLTIPARAEAHGKRAGEFAGLVVLWGRNGPYALAIGEKTFSQRTYGQGKKRGAVSTRNISSQQGAILFWLVKSSTQEADPTVLPDKDNIYQNIRYDVANYMDRSLRRGGPAT